MDIKGFTDVSFVDWDTKIASVIFLPNCNFRCPFCHNVNLVLNPEKIETIPISYLEDQLEQQKEWIDGICITGGEPTLHKDLPELCFLLKKKGIQIKLDTNGTNPSMLRELIARKLIDYVSMDIKAPLTDKKYSQATGVNTEKTLKKVKESIKLLMKSNIDYEFRTTVVPTLHDKEDIKQISNSIKGCKKYILQKFDVSIGKTTLNPDFVSKSFSAEEMQNFLVSAQKIIPNTKLR